MCLCADVSTEVWSHLCGIHVSVAEGVRRGESRMEGGRDPSHLPSPTCRSDERWVRMCLVTLGEPTLNQPPTHLMAPWPDLGSHGLVHPFPEGGGLGKFKGKTSLVNQKESSRYQHHAGGR